MTTIPYQGNQWPIRDLAVAHGLDPAVVRARYKNGKREYELVAPVVSHRNTRDSWRYKGLM